MRHLPPHENMVLFGLGAVQLAQDVRGYHRKNSKPGDRQRLTDVDHALGRIAAAMRPIRSKLGHAPYEPINEDTQRQLAELREVSRKLQAERRKLWKLRGKRLRKKTQAPGLNREP